MLLTDHLIFRSVDELFANGRFIFFTQSDRYCDIGTKIRHPNLRMDSPNPREWTIYFLHSIGQILRYRISVQKFRRPNLRIWTVRKLELVTTCKPTTFVIELSTTY
jgi:hypothetical protein